MKGKIRKLIFEYTRNSRITTKELGKLIGASQQSASYLLKNLKKKKIIQEETTIIDPIKLGFMKVIVGFNLLKLDSSIKRNLLAELKTIPSITEIEECSEGTDLLIAYTSQNLSAFNKLHSEIVHRFYEKIKTAFVFPLIVSHKYNKNYLTRKFDDSDIILFGDRELKELTNTEDKLLTELSNNPREKIVTLSTKLKIPVKTLLRTKRSLEKKRIIRSYSAIIDFAKLNIKREIILLKFTSEGIMEIEKFHNFTRRNRNIIEFMKIIGEYHAIIIVESTHETNTLAEIRNNFPIENYFIIRSSKIHKKKYLPI